MADVLRSLLAEFQVVVDREGALAKGSAQVDALKLKLEGLVAAARPAAKAVSDVFAKAAADSSRYLQAANARAFGGRDSSDGFAAAGAMRSGAMLGPGRTEFAANRAAAEAYAQSLRGRLGSALAEVRAGFNAPQTGLLDSLFSVRTAMLGLGAGFAVRGLMRWVDGIGDLSEGASRLGVTVEQFQRLRVLAEQNGTSVQSLGTAFRTLATNANDPSKDAAAGFAKLGVSVRDAAGELKDPQALFLEVGEALAGVTNETERTALGQKLLGRSAIELKPLFAEGSAAFRDQAAALADLNVLSGETVRRADALSDQWKRLRAQFLALGAPVLEKIILPALEGITDALGAMADWLAKVTAKTNPARVALAALALTLGHYLPILSAMIGLGGGWTKVLLRWAGAGLQAAKSFAKIVIPLLIIEDILGFFTGADSATGRLLDYLFGEGTAEGVQQTIRDTADAFRDLWYWITGGGTGEKAMAFFRELRDSIRVMASDLAALAGIGKGGANGAFAEDPSYKAGFQQYVEGLGTRLGGALGASPPVQAPAYGPPLPPSVQANGDRVVQITVGPNASPQEIGRAASGALERDRAAVMAGVP